MIKRLIFKVAICLVVMTQVSCEEDKEVGLTSIYQLEKYDPNRPLIDLEGSYWEHQKISSFPQGISFYKSIKTEAGKAAQMSLLVFRPNRGIELKPVVSSTAKTPSRFFEDEPGEVYATMNGGFASGNTSLSLVMHNSVVGSVNVKSLNRPFNGQNTTYYPTRAAFGLSPTLVPSVSWVYSVGTGNGVLYGYPEPAKNELGVAPLPAPTTVFPQGAGIWDVSTAIGGSPMLIKDGQINISDANELIAVDNTSSRARSAIGYLENGNVVMLAAQGGIPDVSPGLTLRELAEVMLDLGCKGAINLDGGGSTSFIVNGEQTITPSSSGVERAVPSALIIKKK